MNLHFAEFSRQNDKNQSDTKMNDFFCVGSISGDLDVKIFRMLLEIPKILDAINCKLFEIGFMAKAGGENISSIIPPQIFFLNLHLDIDKSPKMKEAKACT